jgi:hypothetical protein
MGKNVDGKGSALNWWHYFTVREHGLRGNHKSSRRMYLLSGIRYEAKTKSELGTAPFLLHEDAF